MDSIIAAVILNKQIFNVCHYIFPHGYDYSWVLLSGNPSSLAYFCNGNGYNTNLETVSI